MKGKWVKGPGGDVRGQRKLKRGAPQDQSTDSGEASGGDRNAAMHLLYLLLFIGLCLHQHGGLEISQFIQLSQLSLVFWKLLFRDVHLIFSTLRKKST